MVEAHNERAAMLLAQIFDATKWYDELISKIILESYNRYDGDKAWRSPFNQIPNFVGDRFDDLRMTLARHRAKKRMQQGDTSTVARIK